MPGIYERCAGLDVPKKTVVACVLTPAGQETRTFGAMTSELLGRSDGLRAWGYTHVAMESTGAYWKPVFNILEGRFEGLLVKAQHVKAGPGRKTDVNDAAWLAELLQHGWLRTSFIPPVAQRELRDLTRYLSTFARERVTLVSRGQKLLGEATIKLAAVASAIMGVSGRARRAARLAGHADPQAPADVAKGRLRTKGESLANALEGRGNPPHRLVVTARLGQIDSLDETIARFDAQIQEISTPFEAAIGRLATMPGAARPTAAMLVAGIGTEMRYFPRADYVASWAGVAPGHYESAGKCASGKTRKGTRFLRTV
jgi:transposase